MSDLWGKPKSLRDVADDIVSQIDDDPDSGAVDPSTAQPVANQATNQQPLPAANPPNVTAFFNANYDRIAGLAQDMNVPPNLLLGLSAYESGWGNKKNLFGSSINEVPNQYPNADASIDAFRKSQWFDRLSGKGDTDSFLGEMMNSHNGTQGTYNNKNPNYAKELRGTIDTINRRLPIWEQSR